MEDVIFERSYEALDAVTKLAQGVSEPAVIEGATIAAEILIDKNVSNTQNNFLMILKLQEV